MEGVLAYCFVGRWWCIQVRCKFIYGQGYRISWCWMLTMEARLQLHSIQARNIIHDKYFTWRRYIVIRPVHVTFHLMNTKHYLSTTWEILVANTWTNSPLLKLKPPYLISRWSNPFVHVPYENIFQHAILLRYSTIWVITYEMRITKKKEMYTVPYHSSIDKGKASPLQAWTGPEGSRRLRLPDFTTISTWRW